MCYPSVSDFLTRARPTGFYGYPRCEGGRVSFIQPLDQEATALPPRAASHQRQELTLGQRPGGEKGAHRGLYLEVARRAAPCLP